MGLSTFAGLGGLAGSAAALFGGGANQPSAPPQFIMPGMGNAAGNAFGGISGLQPFSNVAGSTIGPSQSAFNTLFNNPGAGALTSGANTAMGMGTSAATSAFNAGNAFTGAGLNTIPMANQLFTAGFDPQSALYNQTLQQVTDQTRAGLEARGIDNTPYGAGVEGNTLGQFNIAWQNNQLQRELAGAQGAGSLLNTGAGITNTGTGIANAAPGQFFNASGMPFAATTMVGQGQNNAVGSLIGNTSSAANLANLPVQDWLSYISAGNQANSVANQNYQAQLQAQNQQFNQSMALGSMMGRSLYGLGQSIPSSGTAFLPSASFVQNGFGFG